MDVECDTLSLFHREMLKAKYFCKLFYFFSGNQYLILIKRKINILTCIDFVQPILLLKVTSPSIWLSFKGKQFLTMETNNLILHALVWSDLCHIKSELACVMLELWRADQNVWHWEPSVNWRPPTIPPCCSVGRKFSQSGLWPSLTQNSTCLSFLFLSAGYKNSLIFQLKYSFDVIWRVWKI